MLLFIINVQKCVSDTKLGPHSHTLNFWPKCHLYAYYDDTQTHWNWTEGAIQSHGCWCSSVKKTTHLLSMCACECMCIRVHVNVWYFVCGGVFFCNTSMPCSCWFIVGCHIKRKKSHHSLLCVCVCVHVCVCACVFFFMVWVVVLWLFFFLVG